MKVIKADQKIHGEANSQNEVKEKKSKIPIKVGML